MSTRTGAPAALARSEGVKVLTKGTAVATPPTAPAPQVIAIQVRRLRSMAASLMQFLGASGVQGDSGQPAILDHADTLT